MVDVAAMNIAVDSMVEVGVWVGRLKTVAGVFEREDLRVQEPRRTLVVEMVHFHKRDVLVPRCKVAETLPRMVAEEQVHLHMRVELEHLHNVAGQELHRKAVAVQELPHKGVEQLVHPHKVVEQLDKLVVENSLQHLRRRPFHQTMVVGGALLRRWKDFQTRYHSVGRHRMVVVVGSRQVAMDMQLTAEEDILKFEEGNHLPEAGIPLVAEEDTQLVVVGGIPLLEDNPDCTCFVSKRRKDKYIKSLINA